MRHGPFSSPCYVVEWKAKVISARSTLCHETGHRSDNSSIFGKHEKEEHLSKTRKGIKKGFLGEIILEC